MGNLLERVGIPSRAADGSLGDHVNHCQALPPINLVQCTFLMGGRYLAMTLHLPHEMSVHKVSSLSPFSTNSQKDNQAKQIAHIKAVSGVC